MSGQMQGEFVSASLGEGFALLRVKFPHDLSGSEQERAGEEVIASADAADQPMVIVDLSDMDVAYSSFLGALPSLLQKQKERGGRLLLVSVRPPVAQTLQRCALDVLFESSPSVEAALGTLTNDSA